MKKLERFKTGWLEVISPTIKKNIIAPEECCLGRGFVFPFVVFLELFRKIPNVMMEVQLSNMHFKKERKIKSMAIFSGFPLSSIKHEVWVGKSSSPLSRLG